MSGYRVYRVTGYIGLSDSGISDIG